CPHLEELALHTPMVLPEHTELQVQVLVETTDTQGRRPVAVYARPTTTEEETEKAGESDSWVCHASGFLTREPVTSQQDTDPGTQLGPLWPPAGAQTIPVDDLYPTLAESGYDYGPLFQGLRAAWRHGQDIYAEIALPEQNTSQRENFGIHPALLDAALH